MLMQVITNLHNKKDFINRSLVMSILCCLGGILFLNPVAAQNHQEKTDNVAFTDFVLSEDGGQGFSGIWTTPILLSSQEQQAISPAIATNAAGNGVVIWQNCGAENRIVGRRVKEGVFSQPFYVSRAGFYAYSPHIATDEKGNSVAVWNECVGNHHLLLARSTHQTGKWSRPRLLSQEEGQNTDFQWAIQGNGKGGIAVWTHQTKGSRSVEAALMNERGEWSPPAPLSTADITTYEPQIACNPKGEAVAIWRCRKQDRAPSSIQVTTLSSKSLAGSVSTLSTEGEDTSFPRIVIDNQGNACAVWCQLDGGNYLIYGSHRNKEGEWSNPECLTPNMENCYEPNFSFNEKGNLFLVWREGFRIWSRKRTSLGVWGPITLLSQGRYTFSDVQAIEPTIFNRRNTSPFVIWTGWNHTTQSYSPYGTLLS